MVQIRTPDSKIFEEAHLVLRTEGEALSTGEDDMLAEANRIIEDAGFGIASGKHRHRRRSSGIGLGGFLLGGLLGSGTVGVVWLLFALL